jgi:hypothetical protein
MSPITCPRSDSSFAAAAWCTGNSAAMTDLILRSSIGLNGPRSGAQNGHTSINTGRATAITRISTGSPMRQ